MIESGSGVTVAADDPANLVLGHSFESLLTLVRNLTRE